MLFKVDCLVDGRKLDKLYASLDGLAYNVSPPIPVKGAQVENGKVKATNGNGSFAESLYQELRQRRIEFPVIADIKAALEATGRQASSINYAIDRMKTAKLLRPTSKKGIYKLNPPKKGHK